MKSIRQVLAGMPELVRFSERLESPDWPTPEEVARAEHALAQGRVRRQEELDLNNEGRLERD